MIQNKNKILVVVAHPDDEVLGCGAVIAKYSKENDVFIAILGEGISSRYEKREEAPKNDLLLLQDQSREAGRILGAKDIFFFNFPDNRFDTLPLLKITKKIEETIRKIQPDIIYTHHGGDLNIDHRITFQAVLTATRPTSGFPVKEIYSFEVPSATEWSFAKINGQFSPNVFDDVAAFISKKIECMKIYETELKKFPHPRSEEALMAIARRWGSVAGVEYAEAFELIRSIK